MRLLRGHGADVIPLDSALNDRDGYDALGRLRAEFPPLNVPMPSTCPESQFGARAVPVGQHNQLATL